ncbi:acyl transferase/acyl hydrolase/lysophospholipase, partial [Mycena epipterygia]
MSRTLPKHGPDRGVRVLSLDGGGAGALSELLILDRMMYRTKTEGQLDAIPSPCECFELIGGSGTGGIIALMLGRLRMSVKEAILAYNSLRPQSKIGFAEEFQASKFEEALENIFNQEKMEDISPNACKTFVCAMNQMNMNAGIPTLFRSYDTPDEPANDCLIWEAARATSATPGLFKPMMIGLSGIEQQYIDGCIGNNNPTSLVLEEAKQMYPLRPVVLVSSIGTGYPDVIRIPQPLSASAMTKAFKMIATDCERTHEDHTRKFRSNPNIYFRFNVQQGLQGFEAQHWEKSSEVSAHTNAYLSMADTKSKLTQAVKVILNPAVPVSEPPVYLRVCPTATFRFTGRQDILEKMKEYFSMDVGRRHIFLLYGLGGAGKSQIAFKFVEISTVSES